MTAMAANKGPLPRKWGLAALPRRPWAGTYAAAKHGYWGALHMLVDGVARPLLSGTSMEAIATAVGTGNAGLLVTARRRYVKLAIVDPSAASQAAYIDVSPSTVYTVVSVYVATNGGSAITSTAKEVMNLIRGHAQANDLLRVVLAGTGASAIVAAAAASMVAVEIGGTLDDGEIDNSSGGALTLKAQQVFYRNLPGDGTGLLAPSTPPSEGGTAFLIDDQTCSATQASGLDLQAPCIGAEVNQGTTTFYYCDLSAAR